MTDAAQQSSTGRTGPRFLRAIGRLLIGDSVPYLWLVGGGALGFFVALALHHLAGLPEPRWLVIGTFLGRELSTLTYRLTHRRRADATPLA